MKATGQLQSNVPGLNQPPAIITRFSRGAGFLLIQNHMGICIKYILVIKKAIR